MAKLPNYTPTVSLIKDAAAILGDLCQTHPSGFDADLKKFYLEAKELSGEQKGYTPERCAKLSASLSSYMITNTLEMQGALKEIYEGFNSVIEDPVAKAFAESALEITQLLRTYRVRHFMEAELYFIDENGANRILEIAKRLDGMFERKTDERRFGIKRLVNLLNLGKDKDTKTYALEEVSHKYSVKYISKFQQINRPESVKSYLPNHYEVWRNQIIKQHKELLATHDFDAKTIENIITEHNTLLQRADEEYRYLSEHFDEYEVRIAGYEHATLYPSISYVTPKRTNVAHLRSEVPNALWFKPSPYRADMSVKAFIESAQHAFGDVYYTPKDQDD